MGGCGYAGWPAAFQFTDGRRFFGWRCRAREAGLLNGGSLYDFYATKDGRYISIGPLEPKSWQGFCELIEHPEWAKLGA